MNESENQSHHPALAGLVEALEERRLDRREFLRSATLLGLSAAAAYGMIGAPPPETGRAAHAATPPVGGTVRISMRVPDLKQPHIFSWVYDSNVLRQSNDYLTRTGSDNVTRPSLLERWAPAPDLRSWTLHLRRDVKWSNGEPLVADHVIWNMRRWLDPAVGSSMLSLMGAYMLDTVATGERDEAGQPTTTTRLWSSDAIEKLDDFTIELHCKRPQLAVPEHLFHYPAVILHPSEDGEWGEGAIGTGAFRPVSVETGKRVVLRRNEAYWDEGPYLDELVFIDHGDDPAAALAALASKQIHGMYEASTLQYHALARMDHVELHTIRSAQTGIARMQPRAEPFGDPRVRKAMRLALDTEKLLAIGHLGLGDPGEHHHVAPVHPEYVPLPRHAQDIEGARRLLAEAGYPDGFETEIACKKDPAWELMTVQAMSEMWKAIGVDCRIRVMPSAQYWDIWTEAPFAFTSWTHRPLAIMTLALAYRTGAPWNESAWSSAPMDALLARAEGTLDPDETRAIMREIEMLMQEEGPICQPLWRAVFTPMDKRVKGFQIHPSYYMFAEQWWLEE
ncbi:MAG: ABC transporter substrate-binding protein [Proteobacteria bacterium]|nr:ABC transporter substrate-binding protein [Pseudomonadota bacterium]